jgi:type I restriction enzyme, S subunit
MVITAQDTKLKQGYKQTGVGVIPEDWEVKPIGESFDICNHLRYPISQEVRKKMVGEYPYYGPTRVQDYINEYRVEGEYALIGEDGDHFLKWRESSMTLLVNGKFNVNNHAHLVKGARNLTSWFYYYFQNKDLTPYLTRQGAGRYKLTKNTLITIPCSFPSLAEQQAIVDALSDVDALITSLDRLIAKKRDIKQATMQQLLTGKTRLPGFSGDWEVQVLGEIAEIIDPHPSHRAPPESHNGIPFVGIGDISTDGKINYQTSRIVSEMIFEQHNKRYSLENGLIGIGRVASIGKVVRLLSNVGKFVVSPTIAVIKPQKVEIDLLFYCLTSKEVKGQFDRISNGSTRQSVGMNVLRDIQLFLPKSLAEQRAIADILTDMDAEIAALEQKRDKTRALKQGMMQELLTGKTRLV